MHIFATLKLKAIFTESKKINPRILDISSLDWQAFDMYSDALSQWLSLPTLSLAKLTKC